MDKLLALFVGFAYYFSHDFAEAIEKTPDTLLRRFFQFNCCLWFRFAVQVMNSRFRVVAILAFRNESYYARTCIEHLIAEGIKCVVIDNESDDNTLDICREYYPEHVIAIDSVPYPGYYDWQAILRRKDSFRQSIDSDWFIHHDADEIMHSNRPGETLLEAIARVDREGYNAIDFDEFVFVHENDSVDYEGQNYYEKMRYYYRFQPVTEHPRLVRAYSSSVRGEIAGSGGHVPREANIRIYPEKMVLRHYICLSKAHAIKKYGHRNYSEGELRKGWHRNRVGVKHERYRAPDQQKLHRLGDDMLALDYRNPYSEHFWHWGDFRWFMERRKRRLIALGTRILHRFGK